MRTEQCAELKGNGKQQPVFEGLRVQAELLDTLSSTTITQTYRNSGKHNIEAVYTFPLPLDAVLLEMTVTLGDKILKGTVLPKQEAEEQYEEAIVEGDAPVMLQTPQPGIYTMNVGNLLPGEKAVISFRYGMFQSWQGDTLRYHLPTTIAPRYGSAENAGLEAHQEPETSLLADNLFSFDMAIRSKAADLLIESPSHSIAIERKPDTGENVITLDLKTAFMDRDLIITVQKSAQQTATARLGKDGDEYLVWASFQPQFNLAEDTTPRSVKIVVDCSGSMAGDSIDQAREALLRVLDELRPQDWFNIVAFGDRATPLFNAQVMATPESIAFARGYLRKLNADMGGTEIGNALKMAVRLRCPEKIQQNVLLITDGEVWEWEKIIANAQKDKHRFFTVGVGSSVSEAFVKNLAERTGGVCELVSPNENMAERIHRHFKRISTPHSTGNEVVWPIPPLRIYPEKVQSIYEGDTCDLFAWFDQPPAGELLLKIDLPDGSAQAISACIDQPSQDNSNDGVTARMAAALKLRELTDEKIGQELAMKYQLISRWTNYLAIVQREEGDKADTLPELHKMQQMLAAGWGGTGTTLYSAMQPVGVLDIPCFLRAHVPIAPAPAKRIKLLEHSGIVKECQALYGEEEADAAIWAWNTTEDEELDQFVILLDEVLSTGMMPSSINLPLLPHSIVKLLKNIVAEGFSEQTIVTLFLYYLSGSRIGEDWLSRQSQRVIQKAYKQLQLDITTEKQVRERLTRQKQKKVGFFSSLSRKLLSKAISSVVPL
mgnify:CR=1 FL=1